MVGDGDLVGDADLLGDADVPGEGDLLGDTVPAGEVVRNSDSEGVRFPFGEGATPRADDCGVRVVDTCDVEEGALCVASACGWACGESDLEVAPVRAKTAATEAATSPPVIQAEASGREMRRRSGRPALAAPGGPEAGPAKARRILAAAESRRSAAEWSPRGGEEIGG